MGDHWNLQDAKNQFPALVDAARRGEPQHVTTQGVDAVVVLAAEEYERLAKLDPTPKMSFVDHIMAFPKLPEAMEDIFDKREPMLLAMTNLEFDE